MKQTISAARWHAVSKLQKIRSHHAPGSFESDVADCAIDLALSPDRKEDNFFLRNVWRDARSICIKRKRRTAERVFVTVSTDGEDDSKTPHSNPIELAGTALSIEGILGLREQIQQLYAAVSGTNRYAGAVLDGWFEGYEMAETAETLQISERYVKKLRVVIRTTAVNLAVHGSAA